MFCVFIKELRQFRHANASIMLFAITALLSVGALACHYTSNVSYILLSKVFLSFAHLFGAVLEFQIIIAASVRWKKENGDGSMDIIKTTPLSPLAVACGKTAAASLVAFSGLLLSLLSLWLTSGVTIQIATLLALALLQATALCAVSLGAATFQRAKNSGFDFLNIFTVLAISPLLTLLFRKGPQIIKLDWDTFFASGAGLAAAIAVGVALAVCGASPRSADRAMPLKITACLAALVLPLIYHVTVLRPVFPAFGTDGLKLLGKYLGTSLFVLCCTLMAGALFERKLQSRRVLANFSSKLLFPFSTGVAGSFILIMLSGAAASLLAKDSEAFGILSKLLLVSGFCQLLRDRQGEEFPALPLIVITVITMALTFNALVTPEQYHNWIKHLVCVVPSPYKISIPAAVCGTVMYAVASTAQFKQYFCKEKSSNA